MKKCFVINGAGTVGKDTIVMMVTEYFRSKNINVFNISSVEKVKEAGKLLGWDEKKDDKGRKFLSDLKDLSTDNYDGPFKFMFDKYVNGPDGLYFFHIREPEEIYKFVKATEAITIAVTRTTSIEYTNHADINAYNYKYDIIIDNSGTLSDLTKAVEEFCNTITI